MKRNRGKLDLAVTNKEYKTIVTFIEPYDDMYWYYKSYPSRNRGTKAYKIRKKQLFSYQRRMYRTWKHTRKTQWI